MDATPVPSQPPHHRDRRRRLSLSRGPVTKAADLMSARFEELDWQATPRGEISLRRRLDPSLGVEVYEVRLGEDYLMSSLFTVAEVELAQLGLAEVTATEIDVVVGGLGLGYTALGVLRHPSVRSLQVVEALGAVIQWHHRGLIPLAAELTADPRCSLVEGDFFMAVSDTGFGPGTPERVHAILVDIDHTPSRLLHPSHAEFYTVTGLRRLSDHLHPGGVFALWSDDPPDEDFLAALRSVFSQVEPHVVRFPNPHTGATAANTVYVSVFSERLSAAFPVDCIRT